MRRPRKLFKDIDPAEARRVVQDYFTKEFLPDDNPARGEDEEAAREHMFDKLADLAKVVEEVKKGLRKKK